MSEFPNLQAKTAKNYKYLQNTINILFIKDSKKNLTQIAKNQRNVGQAFKIKHENLLIFVLAVQKFMFKGTKKNGTAGK